MLCVKVAQTDCRYQMGMSPRSLDELDEDVQVLFGGVLHEMSISQLLGFGRDPVSATHIVPVELQQLHAAAKTSRSLPDSLEHVFGRHRPVERTKDAPLGSSIDRVPDFSRQSTAKVSVDELSITLRLYRQPWFAIPRHTSLTTRFIHNDRPCLQRPGPIPLDAQAPPLGSPRCQIPMPARTVATGH